MTTPIDFPIAQVPHSVVFACDEWLVAHKPHHLLIHRTDWAAHDDDNLRDRLLVDGWAGADGFLQPVHRLDRPTSGLVIFARTADAHGQLHKLFLDRLVAKSYFALIRGWLPEPAMTVDKPLPTSHSPEPKPARTRMEELERLECDFAMTRYPTTRLSLIRCTPETGRFHQIRLHLKHLRHPILGDTAHGDRAHNRWLRNSPHPFVLMLHAGALQFELNGEQHGFSAPFSPEMQGFLDALGFQAHHNIFE
jgi:tRNA pseudouridine65 synthase